METSRSRTHPYYSTSLPWAMSKMQRMCVKKISLQIHFKPTGVWSVRTLGLTQILHLVKQCAKLLCGDLLYEHSQVCDQPGERWCWWTWSRVQRVAERRPLRQWAVICFTGWTELLTAAGDRWHCRSLCGWKKRRSKEKKRTVWLLDRGREDYSDLFKHARPLFFVSLWTRVL